MDSLHSCHGGEKGIFSGKGEGVASRLFLSLAVDKEVQNWVRRDLGGKGDKSERERHRKEENRESECCAKRGGEKVHFFLSCVFKEGRRCPSPLFRNFLLHDDEGGRTTDKHKKTRER